MRTSAAPALDAASYSSRPGGGAQEDDRPGRQFCGYRRTVDVRQAVVEDDDVRLVLVKRADRGSAICDRLDHVEPGSRGEQEHEGVAIDVVVLDEQDADGLGLVATERP